MLGVDVNYNPVLKLMLIGDGQLKALGILAFLMFCASSSTTRCHRALSQRSRSRCSSEWRSVETRISQ